MKDCRPIEGTEEPARDIVEVKGHWVLGSSLRGERIDTSAAVANTSLSVAVGGNSPVAEVAARPGVPSRGEVEEREEGRLIERRILLRRFFRAARRSAHPAQASVIGRGAPMFTVGGATRGTSPGVAGDTEREERDLHVPRQEQRGREEGQEEGKEGGTEGREVLRPVLHAMR